MSKRIFLGAEIFMVKNSYTKKPVASRQVFLSAFFLTPFIMNVEHYIKVCLPISDESREYRLAKGVELYTDKVCEPMILFLTEQFEINPNCLVGDIRSLYERRKEIVQKKAVEMASIEEIQAEM